MFPCHKYLNCNPVNYQSYSVDGELKYCKCNDCKLIWRSNDSMHIEKNYSQSYFDSKKYASKRKHKVKKSGWLLDIALNFNPKISSMLEIGCSLGYTLEAAKKRNIQKILGTDISKYAVDYCKEAGFNAETATFDKLIKRDESYGLIFMQHVLEHFPDPFDILRKCHQLLNNDGIILLMVPNSEYRNAKKQKGKHRFYSIKGVGSEHYVYFNYKNLEKTLKNSGFETIQKNYPVFLKNKNNADFLLNRIFRKSLGIFNADQEILIIAQKVSV